MQVFSNLWGGEGMLTSASLLTMASVGMFNDIHDNQNQLMEIYYRCLDANDDAPDNKKWKEMRDSYNKYFNIIFSGETNCLINDDNKYAFFPDKNDPKCNLIKKYENPEYLALGFSEDEINLNITNGIYGKPWIGEAYYANTDFSPLYSSASGNIIVINGGGYKGGGTAASFIYLENRYDVCVNNPTVTSCKRFDVVVGPSTQFDKYIELPHPEIYSEPSLKGKINQFDAGKILEKLEAKQVTAADDGYHKDNINFLRTEWGKIYSSDHDYTALDPKNYMPRFIDRVSSDVTLTKVVPFINMKYPLIPEGESYKYDITSERFDADNQKHRLHITNLLSAVTIQEIAMNHNSTNYQNGHIYTFCIPNSSKYTIDGVFSPGDAQKLFRFLAFSTMIIKYIYNCFYDITKPGADILLTKWALSRKKLIGGPAIILDNKRTEGKLNFAFANFVKDYFAKFVKEYILSVLNALKDIDDTSDEVEFFGKSPIQGSKFENGLYGIVNDLIESVSDENAKTSINALSSAAEISDATENTLAAIIMGRPGKSNDFQNAYASVKGANGGTNFLEAFQTGIGEFGSINNKKERIWDAAIDENNVQSHAEAYCRGLITYTYSQIKNNLL